MSRRIPTQTHREVSRLLRTNVLKKEPKWYQAVLRYPPLSLPAKAPARRSQHDMPSQVPSTAEGGARPLREKQIRPEQIYYLEDDIRRQFFRDHPFEAFRPSTLVEGYKIRDPHSVNGKEWTRLVQRGRRPTAEDAVQFSLNLHKVHGIPISEAYSRSVSQFRSLRSEHQYATRFAIIEAQTLGAVYGPNEAALSFAKEKKSLETWKRADAEDEGARLDRKRWKSKFDKPMLGPWSRGKEYTRLWQDGIRPDYAPAITSPVGTAPPEQVDTEYARNMISSNLAQIASK